MDILSYLSYLGNILGLFIFFDKEQLGEELSKMVRNDRGIDGYIPADYEDEDPTFRVYLKFFKVGVKFYK